MISCFTYESFNGILKSYVHGSNCPQLQISSAVTTFLYLKEIKDKLLKRDSAIYGFCEKIEKSGTHRRKLKKIDEKTFICGISVKVRDLPNYVIDICCTYNLTIDPTKCHFFNRLLKSGIYYETEHYARNKKSNSSCVQFMYDNTTHVGFIKTFFRICKCPCILLCEKCVVECKTYVIISECDTAKPYKCSVSQRYISTISTCHKTENLRLINVNDISNICYYVRVDEKFFALELTNNKEIKN